MSIVANTVVYSILFTFSHQYVKQGGVQVKVEEKSQAEKIVDVALGKAKKGTLKDKTNESIQEKEASKLAELEK